MGGSVGGWVVGGFGPLWHPVLGEVWQSLAKSGVLEGRQLATASVRG